jgi:hypothetical protein
MESLDDPEIAHWDDEPEIDPSPALPLKRGEGESNPVRKVFGALRRARFMKSLDVFSTSLAS